jgi:hypothetical protein
MQFNINDTLNLDNLDNDDIVELNFNRQSSYIEINKIKYFFINNNINGSNNDLILKENNELIVYLKELEIDLNPKLLMEEYKFKLTFKIKLLPIYFNLSYVSSYDTDSLMLFTKNIY